MKTLVKICDTTLRDGEQAPGFSMTPKQKLQVAVQLEHLGVDRIEAGFASASQADFEAIEAISRSLDKAEVMSFARANSNDIEVAARALDKAKKPVIHTFISTSDIHLEYKLGWSRQEALDKGAEAVRHALRLVDTVQFAMEDASRSDPEFVLEAVKVGLEAGATTINIADTVGYILPKEWAALVKQILAVPGMDKAILSVHGHDDLGLGVANALAAIEAGARQVECTINGIGERAGNVSMEELVMILKTRDVNGLDTNIDPKQFQCTSRLVCAVTGNDVPPNKAIVGKNAFAHEAGIHQAGILKNPLTYEVMTPESVGLEGRTLVLGKHSGRQGLAARLKDLGFVLSKQELNAAYARFSEIADKKKVVDDEDLVLIANPAANPIPAGYRTESLRYIHKHN